MKASKKASNKDKKTKGKKDCRIILHNIRSTYNVGSIFRTADAAGVSKIYISGYTPAPVDRFGRLRKDIAKVSLGAEESVPWQEISSASRGNVTKLINDLKKEKFKIIAVEQNKNSVDYKKVALPARSVIIVGNEVSGVAENILELCDVIAEIPMHGMKESLNVSVAIGIALFRLNNL